MYKQQSALYIVQNQFILTEKIRNNTMLRIPHINNIILCYNDLCVFGFFANNTFPDIISSIEATS